MSNFVWRIEFRKNKEKLTSFTGNLPENKFKLCPYSNSGYQLFNLINEVFYWY